MNSFEKNFHPTTDTSPLIKTGESPDSVLSQKKIELISPAVKATFPRDFEWDKFGELATDVGIEVLNKLAPEILAKLNQYQKLQIAMAGQTDNIGEDLNALSGEQIVGILSLSRDDYRHLKLLEYEKGADAEPIKGIKPTISGDESSGKGDESNATASVGILGAGDSVQTGKDNNRDKNVSSKEELNIREKKILELLRQVNQKISKPADDKLLDGIYFQAQMGNGTELLEKLEGLNSLGVIWLKMLDAEDLSYVLSNGNLAELQDGVTLVNSLTYEKYGQSVIDFGLAGILSWESERIRWQHKNGLLGKDENEIKKEKFETKAVPAEHGQETILGNEAQIKFMLEYWPGLSEDDCLSGYHDLMFKWKDNISAKTKLAWRIFSDSWASYKSFPPRQQLNLILKYADIAGNVDEKDIEKLIQSEKNERDRKSRVERLREVIERDAGTDFYNKIKSYFWFLDIGISGKEDVLISFFEVLPGHLRDDFVAALGFEYNKFKNLHEADENGIRSFFGQAIQDQGSDALKGWYVAYLKGEIKPDIKQDHFAGEAFDVDNKKHQLNKQKVEEKSAEIASNKIKDNIAVKTEKQKKENFKIMPEALLHRLLLVAKKYKLDYVSGLENCLTGEQNLDQNYYEGMKLRVVEDFENIDLVFSLKFNSLIKTRQEKYSKTEQLPEAEWWEAFFDVVDETEEQKQETPNSLNNEVRRQKNFKVLPEDVFEKLYYFEKSLGLDDFDRIRACWVGEEDLSGEMIAKIIDNIQKELWSQNNLFTVVLDQMYREKYDNDNLPNSSQLLLMIFEAWDKAQNELKFQQDLENNLLSQLSWWQKKKYNFSISENLSWKEKWNKAQEMLHPKELAEFLLLYKQLSEVDRQEFEQLAEERESKMNPPAMSMIQQLAFIKDFLGIGASGRTTKDINISLEQDEARLSQLQSQMTSEQSELFNGELNKLLDKKEEISLSKKIVVAEKVLKVDGDNSKDDIKTEKKKKEKKVKTDLWGTKLMGKMKRGEVTGKEDFDEVGKRGKAFMATIKGVEMISRIEGGGIFIVAARAHLYKKYRKQEIAAILKELKKEDGTEDVVALIEGNQPEEVAVSPEEKIYRDKITKLEKILQDSKYVSPEKRQLTIEKMHELKEKHKGEQGEFNNIFETKAEGLLDDYVGKKIKGSEIAKESVSSLLAGIGGLRVLGIVGTKIWERYEKVKDEKSVEWGKERAHVRVNHMDSERHVEDVKLDKVTLKNVFWDGFADTCLEMFCQGKLKDIHGGEKGWQVFQAWGKTFMAGGIALSAYFNWRTHDDLDVFNRTLKEVGDRFSAIEKAWREHGVYKGSILAIGELFNWINRTEIAMGLGGLVKDKSLDLFHKVWGDQGVLDPKGLSEAEKLFHISSADKLTDHELKTVAVAASGKGPLADSAKQILKTWKEQKIVVSNAETGDFKITKDFVAPKEPSQETVKNPTVETNKLEEKEVKKENNSTGSKILSEEDLKTTEAKYAVNRVDTDKLSQSDLKKVTALFSDKDKVNDADAKDVLKTWEEGKLVTAGEIKHGGSIWRSVRELVKTNHEKFDLEEGFTKAQLENKVANLVNQWTQDSGGHIKDLVHAGDKVYLTADNKLVVGEDSGIKSGYLHGHGGGHAPEGDNQPQPASAAASDELGKEALAEQATAGSPYGTNPVSGNKLSGVAPAEILAENQRLNANDGVGQSNNLTDQNVPQGNLTDPKLVPEENNHTGANIGEGSHGAGNAHNAEIQGNKNLVTPESGETSDKPLEHFKLRPGDTFEGVEDKDGLHVTNEDIYKLQVFNKSIYNQDDFRRAYDFDSKTHNEIVRQFEASKIQYGGEKNFNDFEKLVGKKLTDSYDYLQKISDYCHGKEGIAQPKINWSEIGKHTPQEAAKYYLDWALAWAKVLNIEEKDNNAFDDLDNNSQEEDNN